MCVGGGVSNKKGPSTCIRFIESVRFERLTIQYNRGRPRVKILNPTFFSISDIIL